MKRMQGRLLKSEGRFLTMCPKMKKLCLRNKIWWNVPDGYHRVLAYPEGAQEYTLLQEYYFCGTPAEKA